MSESPTPFAREDKAEAFETTDDAAGPDSVRAAPSEAGESGDTIWATESDRPQPDEPVEGDLADSGETDALYITSLEAEIEALRDQLLRTAAEFQNYRRRTANERASALEYGKAEVVSRFLEVFDDLRRTAEAATSQTEEPEFPGTLESIQRGVALVYGKFESEMKKLGVEAIGAQDQPFDENLHDALLQQPAPEGVPPGTVLAEVQRGYRMGDRVLRHSKVVVAL